MGILSSIRKKIFRKGDDYDDYKSQITSDFPPPPPLQQPLQQEEPDQLFGSPFDKEPPFPREPEFPGLRKEEFGGPSKDFQRDYDIMDRLNLIEAQIAAIRSQTETINERLKNLEARLVRRY